MPQSTHACVDTVLNAPIFLPQDDGPNDPCATSLPSAVSLAARAADQSELPQTVFRNKDSMGWANTNALSTLLDRSETRLTVLPKRFFS